MSKIASNAGKGSLSRGNGIGKSTVMIECLGDPQTGLCV